MENTTLSEKEICDISAFVTKKSCFDYEGCDNGEMNFAARSNGDSDSHPTRLVNLGYSVKAMLDATFRNIEVDVEAVDEWAIMLVRRRKVKVELINYTFKKDLKGAGFSETFSSMESLIEKYGSWIDIDWELVMTKVEAINIYPNNTYSKGIQSDPIPLVMAGEKGNNWGYNFFVIKTKIQ
ncbi:MAG: hypothetical protein IM631_12515 [Cytophagales bacterium]|nr:hypothetical protein [Cytophagales bacterium]MCA6382338.1 hypothetical protein [Cytophagales bacterium]